MDLRYLIGRMDAIELKEEVDPSDVEALLDKLKNGEIDFPTFRDELDSLEHTDYSMRQGEMGLQGDDTPDGNRAWERDRDEWDAEDQFNTDEYDESQHESVDEPVDECGGEEAPPPGDVAMNVSIDGVGAEGIRQLISLLQNIERGETDSGPDIVIDRKFVGGEEFANEPDEMYGDISSVTRTGGDIHSKGSEALKVNGGGNPLAHKSRLESLYNSIKNR